GDQRFTNGAHECLSFLERLGRLLLVTAMWQFPGAFFLCAVCILGGPFANALDGRQESSRDAPNVTSCRGEASAGEGLREDMAVRDAPAEAPDGPSCSHVPRRCDDGTRHI